MGNELEVKIPKIKVKEVISRLEKLAAEKIFEGEVSAMFFDSLGTGPVYLKQGKDYAEFGYGSGRDRLEVTLLKLTDKDPYEEMCKILKALNYKKTDENQTTEFFDRRPRKLGKDEIVRMRMMGEQTEFTYKKKIKGSKDVKNNDEFEVYPDKFSTMLAILNKIGFMENERIDKHRITYHLSHGKCEIDTIYYPCKVPTYLEFEAETREELQKNVTALGFKWSQTKNWSQADIIKKYKR